ncbi:MAG: hypothetical protein ACJ789_12900 [Thermomicrobiales bacterium]
MTTSRTIDSVSRRKAMAGLAAGGFGLVLTAHGRGVSAQEATPAAMASHPIVGNWMVATPAGPSMAVFLADGTNIQGLPATQAGPNGVVFVSPQVGSWEPVSARGVHFTGVQLHSDASGALVGTVEIDAYPVVSEDGQTLRDDDPRSGPLIRDAAGNIVANLRGTDAPPATGVRMGVGASGLSEGTPSATATPYETSGWFNLPDK